jgi:cytochrome c553
VISVRLVKYAAAALAAAFLVPASALAGKGDINAGRAKAEAACAPCHGEAGLSQMEGVPHLAANIDLFLQWQLVYFRTGRRSNEAMSAVSADLTDADINNLGAYFASLTPVPAPRLPTTSRN